MSKYTKIKIILLLILSVIISVSAYRFLNSLKSETTVVIAVGDIDERTWIRPEMLKEIGVRSCDKDILAPDAVTSIDELQFSISKVKIEKDKPINSKEDVIIGTMQSLLNNKVILENGEINDAYFITSNTRLLTIRVDSHGAVGNKLMTGDHVDVIFTTTNQNANNFSVTLLQHIEIFDIEQKEKGAEGYQNVCLVVTPQQAVDLTYAKRTGRIDLTLNPVKGDNEITYPASIHKFVDENNYRGQEVSQ